MITRHSIIFKIALHLAVSSSFLILLLALINTRFIQRQYRQVEQDKLASLMKNALSTLGINLSYEFYDAVRETGNTLLLNDGILFVKIIPTGTGQKFTFFKNPETDLEYAFTKTMDIKDPGTGKTIGTFSVAYSREKYTRMMHKYHRYQSAILALYLLVVLLIIRSLLKKIRPLSSLAEQMQAFVPGKEIQLLDYHKGNDEISKIAESANVMLQNIGEYAERLQQMNIELKKSHDELEQRVKARTEELQEKQLQLAHAGRLASLGELAAGIAHELGQPLQIINTASEIVVSEIEEDSLDKDEVLPIARKISAQVNRAQVIINNMRTFARYTQTTSPLPVDIRIPLTECLSFFNEQFYQHQIELTVQMPDSLPLVKTDAQKFQQIVVNLLSNARYAVDKKTSYAKNEAKNVTIALQWHMDNERIDLEIRDNGIGMSSQEQEHCLDPFYTTKDPGEGTGLGLSIAYGIIQECNFELKIISSPGKGTTMRISMPTDNFAEKTGTDG